AQMVGGSGLPAPLRSHAAARGGDAKRRLSAVGDIEQVQTEIGGTLAAYGDAADAVSVQVHTRRIDADANAPGLDREDSAADTAFRRQSGPIQPFDGEVE